jgi:hypothetical protein
MATKPTKATKATVTAPSARKEPLVAAPQPRASRRQEVARNRREERMKAYERNRRQWMITKVVAGTIALAVVAGLVWSGVNYVRDRDLNRVPDGVASFQYAGGQHDDAFNAWTEAPPVGGTHNNIWQKCGYYDGQITTGMGVHTMEHGAIWITYSPDLPQEAKDKLRQMAEGDSWLLVSEFPGLPSPIVASAWGKQLVPESADSKELRQFIRVFKNNPQYTPEFGATCATGSEAVIG